MINRDNDAGKDAKNQELNWVAPLLPLLKSFVNAELAAFGDDTTCSESSYKTRKKVTFSAFDFSSVKTPVDMEVESNRYVERSIEALEAVVNEISLLVNEKKVENTRQAKILQNTEIARMLLVFNILSAPHGESKRTALSEVRRIHSSQAHSNKFQQYMFNRRLTSFIL